METRGIIATNGGTISQNETPFSSNNNGGDVVFISEFISQLDEAAATRLQRMNQRLRELEMQMELLENEICKTNHNPSEEWPQLPPSLVYGFRV
ncbi:hypothetical protein FCM35_KLT15603 [Carex littledalei]|uniref:Uncharacterized protein n=1 Tax=Carex littledalei TaxID=544730 RepID=A0A833RHY0_9POAL|nr:hypothetical protein FCM35_KLT15603 [Carex littledalei]